jgi:glycosyltransferase involved in cell wall biosynthesis
MKIALFMLPPLTQGGGAEKYFIELAKNLRKNRIEADIITMDSKFFFRFAKLLYLFAYRKWFRHIDISGRETEENIKANLGKANWLRADFRNLAKILGNYDLVYSKNEIVDLILLKLNFYKNLPPVVVGVHTPLFFPNPKTFITKIHNFLYLGFFYRRLLRGVKCLHVSNSSAKELVDKNFQIKNQLIFYPFSASEIVETSQNFVSALFFDRDKFNIVFTGRLSEQKGIGALANIVSKLAKKHDIAEKIRVNIFGSGDAKHENIVRELANRHSFVKYFGHVENKFIPNILSRHDLFISTSSWETLPYNILEAQALGLPAIAFDIPGPADIIVARKTGFLVENETDFLAKITDFVENRIRLNKDSIIRNVETKFDPKKIYSDIISLFQETTCGN